VLGSYTYDPSGQITRNGGTVLEYAGGHLATSTAGSSVTAYGFDGRGRRVTQASPDASATYSWSGADRLTGYTLDRGRDGSVDVTATYFYDASGQRTSSVVASAGVVTTSTYVWEGISLARLCSTTAGQTTTLSYVMDEAGDPMALSVSLPGTTTVYTLPVWTDGHGDVVKVCDMNGITVARWTYDPYGRPLGATIASTTLVPYTVAQAVAALQPLRYAGYVWDSESGLYYCSQRYFDPQSAQFISRDAIGADAQESAYQYCGGDPVGKTDKTGMIGDWSGTGRVSVLDQVVHNYVHAKTKTKAQRDAKAAFAAKAKNEAKREVDVLVAGNSAGYRAGERAPAAQAELDTGAGQGPRGDGGFLSGFQNAIDGASAVVGTIGFGLSLAVAAGATTGAIPLLATCAGAVALGLTAVSAGITLTRFARGEIQTNELVGTMTLTLVGGVSGLLGFSSLGRDASLGASAVSRAASWTSCALDWVTGGHDGHQ
jgi:RHS repeat-associated protein